MSKQPARRTPTTGRPRVRQPATPTSEPPRTTADNAADANADTTADAESRAASRRSGRRVDRRPFPFEP